MSALGPTVFVITTFRYTSDWQPALLACVLWHPAEFEPYMPNLESGNFTGNISQVVAKLVMSWHGHVWEMRLKGKNAAAARELMPKIKSFVNGRGYKFRWDILGALEQS